jgi:hypothetical protein
MKGPSEGGDYHSTSAPLCLIAGLRSLLLHVHLLLLHLFMKIQGTEFTQDSCSLLANINPNCVYVKELRTMQETLRKRDVFFHAVRKIKQFRICNISCQFLHYCENEDIWLKPSMGRKEGFSSSTGRNPSSKHHFTDSSSISIAAINRLAVRSEILPDQAIRCTNGLPRSGSHVFR